MRALGLTASAIVIAATAAGYGAFLGGPEIAFVRWPPHTVEPCDCPRDIYVMGVDGTGIHRLTHADPYMSNDQPAWSPDGTEIAYVNHWNTHGGSIYVMRANGTQVRRLTDSLDDWGPAWSPDGSKIAFTQGILRAVRDQRRWHRSPPRLPAQAV